MAEFDVNSLVHLVAHSTAFLEDTERNEVMQTLAFRLEEWYQVPRDVLRKHLETAGFTLEERCVSCNDRMPGFDGYGDPLCNACDSEADSVS